MVYDKIKTDCRKLKKYAIETIAIGGSILEFVNNFERMIFKMGYNPAFPVNIAQGNIIAHWTPTRTCIKKFNAGLCILDFGLETGDIIVDTAITIPLGLQAKSKYSEKIKNYRADLIGIAKNTTIGTPILDQIKSIEKLAERYNFQILSGLGGHNILPGKLHGDSSIPHCIQDYDPFNNFNHYNVGCYCIEPFMVVDSNSFTISTLESPIYQYRDSKNRTRYTCDRWSDYDKSKCGYPVDMLVADRSVSIIQEEVCIKVDKTTCIISS